MTGSDTLALRAYRDRLLSESAKRLYDHLVSSAVIVADEPRSVKALALAANTDLHRETVAMSLDELVESGYLSEHEPDGKLRTFRLITVG